MRRAISLYLIMTLGVALGCERQEEEPSSQHERATDNTTQSAPPLPPSVDPALEADRSVTQTTPPESPGLPGTGTGVPSGRIVVDGQADDWQRIPVLLDVAATKSRQTNYDCRAVKVARDESNLYILFVLDQGISERFDQHLKRSGKASGSALGHLHLRSGSRKFVLWIPTGFASAYDSQTDQVTHKPWVSFDVAGAAITDDAYDPVFEADSSEQPDHIAFAGKFLELAIPLNQMGITGEHPIQASLEEMY